MIQILILVLWSSELRNSGLRHVVDYSEKSNSGIVELRPVAMDYSENSSSGIAELRLVAAHCGENGRSGIADQR